MSELKPCPFCNNKFAFDYERGEIRCVSCGAVAPYSPNGELANTRPIEDALTAKIAELAALKEERRWIPVSEPPDHCNSVLVADFDSAETYGCGIPATTGFYFRGEWHLPTGSGVSPTHYKDCIIDNEERGGSKSAHARWSDNFPKSREVLQDENEQKWVSVKDRLPSAAHNTVITFSEDGYVRPADYYRYLSEWRVLYKGNPVLKHVTHWMPMPEPPEGSK